MWHKKLPMLKQILGCNKTAKIKKSRKKIILKISYDIHSIFMNNAINLNSYVSSPYSEIKFWQPNKQI